MSPIQATQEFNHESIRQLKHAAVAQLRAFIDTKREDNHIVLLLFSGFCADADIQQVLLSAIDEVAAYNPEQADHMAQWMAGVGHNVPAFRAAMMEKSHALTRRKIAAAPTETKAKPGRNQPPTALEELKRNLRSGTYNTEDEKQFRRDLLAAAYAVAPVGTIRAWSDHLSNLIHLSVAEIEDLYPVLDQHFIANREEAFSLLRNLASRLASRLSPEKGGDRFSNYVVEKLKQHAKHSPNEALYKTTNFIDDAKFNQSVVQKLAFLLVNPKSPIAGAFTERPASERLRYLLTANMDPKLMQHELKVALAATLRQCANEFAGGSPAMELKAWNSVYAISASDEDAKNILRLAGNKAIPLFWDLGNERDRFLEASRLYSLFDVITSPSTLSTQGQAIWKEETAGTLDPENAEHIMQMLDYRLERHPKLEKFLLDSWIDAARALAETDKARALSQTLKTMKVQSPKFRDHAQTFMLELLPQMDLLPPEEFGAPAMA